MADELLAGIGSETAVLGAQELREAIKLTLDKLGPKERVLSESRESPDRLLGAVTAHCSITRVHALSSIARSVQAAAHQSQLHIERRTALLADRNRKACH
jgi:hypothetical protein